MRFLIQQKILLWGNCKEYFMWLQIHFRTFWSASSRAHLWLPNTRLQGSFWKDLPEALILQTHSYILNLNRVPTPVDVNDTMWIFALYLIHSGVIEQGQKSITVQTLKIVRKRNRSKETIPALLPFLTHYKIIFSPLHYWCIFLFLLEVFLIQCFHLKMQECTASTFWRLLEHAGSIYMIFNSVVFIWLI